MAGLSIAFTGMAALRRTLLGTSARIDRTMKGKLGKAAELIVRNAQTEQMGGRRTPPRKSRRRKGSGPRRATVGRRRVRKAGAGAKRPRAKRAMRMAKPHQLGIVTGRLRRSITADVRRLSAGRWYAEVGPKNIPYARIHEFGGRAGRKLAAKIPPRPYMGPALKATESRVLELIGETFVLR